MSSILFYPATVAAPLLHSPDLTSRDVLQDLIIAGLKGVEFGHDDLLREVLSPLADAEKRATLALDCGVDRDLVDFLESKTSRPSQTLLAALHTRAKDFSKIIDFDSVLHNKSSISGHAKHHQEEALARTLVCIAPDRGEAQAAIPKALSLSDVLANPQRYTKEKPLKIVLFDVDDTTHRGQFSIEWLFLDILRYGPSALGNVSWWRILKALPDIVKLRKEEKAGKTIDRKKFGEVIGSLLEGVDEKLVLESIRRFYDRYGSRGTNPFMLDQIRRHRQSGRLIIGISASYKPLVDLHAKNDLGIPAENILATTFDLKKKILCWLHGKEKVHALESDILQKLREQDIPFRLVAGYSDSHSDQPMLEKVAEDRGDVFAVNPSPHHQAFIRWVMEVKGTRVYVNSKWLQKGQVRFVFSAIGPWQDFSYTQDIPQERPNWLRDVGGLAKRSFADGIGFVVAAPLSEAARRGLSEGQFHWSPEIWSSTPTMAVTGMILSAFTAYLVPAEGPVPRERFFLARGALTMTAVLWASGAVKQNGWGPSLIAILMAAGLTELITVGERLNGLRRWRGGDERTTFAGKAGGFAGLRTLQLVAFQTFIFGIQQLLHGLE